MYIIDVIPLIVLPPQAPQIASYFHSSNINKGTLVEIPYNRRLVLGIVVASISIEKEKSHIKKSSFQLQKIKKVISENRAWDFQLELSKHISQRYSSALGVALKNVLPPFALNKRKILIETPNIQLDTKADKKYIEGPVSRRVEYIKDRIEKRSGQILIIFPDSDLAESFFNLVKDKNKILINSKTKKSLWPNIWNRVVKEDNLIVIGTRQSVFLPFSRLSEVIMEDPWHEMYKSEMTPKYETLNLVQYLQAKIKFNLILSGAIPNIEIWNSIKNKEMEHLRLSSPKIDFEKVISMSEEIQNNNFSILAKESKKKIIDSLTRKKRVFIYSSRKGYSSMLACRNCGLAVTCPNCSSGMRVYKSSTLDLICHHCGHKSLKPNNCSRCHDYNFKMVGAGGSQKIYEEVRNLLEANDLKAPVIMVDTSTIKNDTEEEELLSTIESEEASILIATDMVTSYRFRFKFDTIVIPHTDSIISFPDFGSEDRLIAIIENLRALEPVNLLIQTFNPDSSIIKTIESRDYSEYVNRTLKERQLLAYPPFSRIIKISYSHSDPNEARRQSKIATEKMRRAISHLRLDKDIKMIDDIPSFIHKVANQYRYNIVFKVTNLNLNLYEFLSYVPPRWIFDVDARSTI